MSPDDIITPRQQPRKHVHVSSSPRQRHLIRMSQRLCSPIRNRPGKPETDLDHVSIDFDPGPIDFDLWLLRWPLTKSQNFWNGLSCSVFHVDSNFGLCFFIWNFEIGQLACSSLWFLQRHFSRHLQVIFSCLSNLKPSLSFRLEFEGRC